MADSKKRTRAGGKAGGAKQAASFEDSIGRLEQIVRRLESGELPLEDAVTLFEEGVKLARATQRQLEAAERRVEELLGVDEDGNPLVREIEPEDEE